MTAILIVDDSAADRRLAGGLLMRAGDWTVHFASNGIEAMDQIELHLPDLVLTDMQMPERNGLQLVEEIGKKYPLLPVVLMTAQGSEELAVKALQRGAASYVAKRELGRELIEILERVLVASSKERNSARLSSRMTRMDLSFVLENDLTLLPALVHQLQGAAAQFRIHDESDSLRVGVALEEALLNAYYHGNLEVSSDLREKDHAAYYDLARRRNTEPPYLGRRIFVQAGFEPDEAVYVIRDEGPGFDPRCLPDATAPANLERPCGRGLLLMRTFMDSIRWNDRGNEVTMIRRRRVRADQTSDVA